MLLIVLANSQKYRALLKKTVCSIACTDIFLCETAQLLFMSTSVKLFTQGMLLSKIGITDGQSIKTFLDRFNAWWSALEDRFQRLWASRSFVANHDSTVARIELASIIKTLVWRGNVHRFLIVCTFVHECVSFHSLHAYWGFYGCLDMFAEKLRQSSRNIVVKHVDRHVMRKEDNTGVRLLFRSEFVSRIHFSSNSP